MKLFLLEPDHSNSTSIVFAKEEDASWVLELLNGKPIAEGWNGLEIKRVVKNARGTKKSKHSLDYPTSFIGFPIFSERATTALGNHLTSNGEILPVQCSDGSYFVFNCTRVVDCLDVDSCVGPRFDDGRLITVKKFTFLDQRIEAHSIFIVPQLLQTKIIVSADFVEFAKVAALRGLVFTEIWK